MRLIDADALPKYTGYALSADEVAKAVENAPTIEAEPVRRGRWKEYIDQKSGAQMATCTVCGEATLYGVSYDLKGIRHAMRYCPRCGAKMEERHD